MSITNSAYSASLLRHFSTFVVRQNVPTDVAEAATRLWQAFLAEKQELSDWTEAEVGFFLAQHPNERAGWLVTEFVKLQPPFQVSCALDEYLLALSVNGCSKATIKNYRSDINQFCTFAESNQLDQLISKPKIQAFMAYQLEKGLKPASITRKLVAITQFSLWADQEGWLNRDIAWLEGASLESLTTERLPEVTESVPVVLPPQAKTSQPTLPAYKHSALKPTDHQTTVTHLSEKIENIQRKLHRNTWQWLMPYFNLALMVLFLLGLSFLGYRQFFVDVPADLAYPSAVVRPNRELSFQGRLTDTAQNPITSATNMQFELYDVGPGTGGSVLWDSGTCSVTPDQDGIFNVGLGDDCGTEIPEDVFSENANVWLEVSVAAETLAPRQPIRTVPYALNSETVQGFPVNSTESATVNTLLVMNESGQVVLGETNPVLKSVSGTFTIEGETVLIQTTSGSNGNIVLDADGLGGIILRDYLHAPGATISATYAGGIPLILNSGPSGTAEQLRLAYDGSNYLGLTVNSSGNVTFNPTGGSVLFADNDVLNIGGAGAAGYNFFAGSTAGVSTPDGDNDLYIEDELEVDGTTRFGNITYTWPGSQSTNYILQTNGSGALSWVDPALAGASTIFWSQSDGALYPKNSTVDLLVGGQATTSAKFAVLNMNTGTPTASLSANSGNNALYMKGDGTLATTNRQSLTIGNSAAYNTSGNVLINPNGQGSLAIGTTTPGSAVAAIGGTSGSYNGKLYVGGTFTSSRVAQLGSLEILNGTDGPTQTGVGLRTNGTNSALEYMAGSAGAQTLDFNAHVFHSGIGSPTTMVINNDGNVGIGTTAPKGQLEVSGNGLYGSHAAAIINQTGSFDIFTASASGTTRMVLTNAGNLGLGTTNPTNILETLGGRVLHQWDLNASQFLRVRNASTGTSATAELQLGNDASANAAYLRAYGSNYTSKGNYVELGSSGDYPLLFVTNNFERARISGYDFNIKAQGDLQLSDSDSSNYIALQAPAIVGSNLTYTLPGSVTNGYILQTDGSGTLSWVDPAGASAASIFWNQTNGALFAKNSTVDLLVGGQSSASAKFAVLNVNNGTPTASIAGQTAGYGLYMTGDGTIATTLNRSLLINPNGGNVGIGTTSPVGNLNIKGASTRSIILDTEAVGGWVGIWGGPASITPSAANSKILMSATGELVLNRESGQPFSIREANGTQLHIATGGSVGIGTSSPLATLDVRGQSGTLPVASVSGQTSFAAMVVDNKGVGDIFTASSSGLNRFVITQNGNVGIGTTSPARALQIVSTQPLRMGTTTDYVGFTQRSTNVWGWQGAGSGDYTTTWDLLNNRISIGGSGGAGAGIPVNTLDVNGNVAVGADYQGVNTAPTNGMIVQGNVGIGTTTPGAKLDIVNTANDDALTITANATQSNPLLRLFESDGTTESVRFYPAVADGATAISYNFNTTNALANATARLMSVRNDGVEKVGIFADGSITSAGNLTISGTTTFNSQTYTWPGSQTNGYILQTNGSGTLTWADPSALVGASTYWDQLNGAVYPKNSTVDLLVGGTSTAAAKFAVLNVNSGTPTASISANSGNIATYLTGDGTLATTNRQSLTIGNSSTYNTTGDILLHPNSSGNVAIGTTSAPARLTIHGGHVRLNQSGNSIQDFNGNNLINNTTGTMTIGNAALNIGSVYTVGATASQSFRRNSTTDLFISGAGLIGINTTSPTAQLHVAGAYGSNDAFTVNQLNSGNIFTASSSGTTRMVLSNAGGLSLGSAGYVGTDAGVGNMIMSGNLGVGTTNPLYRLSLGGASSNTVYAGINTNSIAANDTMYYGTGSNAVTGTVNGLQLTANATTGFSSLLNNSNTTDGTANSTLELRTGGASSGDPFMVYTISGLQNWVTGIDNSDSDKFKIGYGSSLASNIAMTLTTTGTVGIGITSPDANSLLNISRNDDTNYDLLIADGGTGDPNLAFNISGTSYSMGIDNSDNDLFKISRSATLGTADVLAINSSSNVGIGTTTIDEKLHVQGNFKLSGTTTFGGLTYTWPGSQTNGYILQTNGSGTLSWADPSVLVAASTYWDQLNGALYPKNSTVDLLVGGTSTAAAKFAFTGVNSGTPTATIAGSVAGAATYLTGDGVLATTLNRSLQLNPSGGNVGIGTTTPNTALQIIGTFRWGGGSTGPSLSYAANDAYYYSGGSGVGNTIFNGGVASPGKFGINTTSPLASFDVRGQSGTLPVASVSGQTSNAALIVDNRGLGDIFTASSSGLNRFVIKQNGNVGIGTTGPTAQLQVEYPNNTGGAYFLINEAGLNNLFRVNDLSSSGTRAAVSLFRDGVSSIYLNTDGTSYFNGNGNVGIGTTTADEKLHVQGNFKLSGTTTLNTQTYTWPGSQTANYILQTNGSGTLSWVDPALAAASSIFWNQANGALFAKNSTVDLLVGGQSSASAKFAVLNVNSGTPTASVSANSGNIATYLTGDGTLATTNRQTLTIGNSSTYDTTGNVVINSNGTGNVGIGQVAPTEKLQVNGDIKFNTATQKIKFDDNNYYMPWNNSNGSDFKVSNAAGRRFAFLGGSNTLMVIQGDTGNVGIGTTAPTAPLHIAGAYGSNDALTINQLNSGNIFTASASGTTRLTLSNGGDLTLASGNVIVDASGTGNYYFGANSLSNYKPHASGVGILSSSGSFVLNLDSDNNATDRTFQIKKDAADISGSTLFTVSENGNITGTGTLTGLTGLTSSGTITFSAFTANGGLLYTNGSGVMAQTAVGSAGECLVSAGGGSPTWSSCSAAAANNYWRVANGAISPYNDTLDLLVGANATTSAKFAFMNVNSGTPVASVSANSGNIATYLTGDGTLATTNRQSLTIGNSSTYDTTGNVVINSNGTGNVGIGTTSPGAKLQIVGTNVLRMGSSSEYVSFIQANTDRWGWYTDNNTYVQQWDFANSRTGFGSGVFAPGSTISVLGNSAIGQNYATTAAPTNGLIVEGNVGIGTTTPTALLDVAGNASTSGTLSFRGTTDPKINVLNGEAFGISLSPGGDAGLYEKFTINQNGTTYINSGMLTQTVSMGRTISEDIELAVTDSTGSFTYDQDETDATSHNFTFNIDSPGTGAADWIFQNRGTETIRFTDDGTVGIGTTAPTAPLHVRGAYGSNDALTVNQLNSGNILSASASGTTRMVLTNAGSLGIGTTIPDAKLNVYGTETNSQIGAGDAAALRITNTSADVAGRLAELQFGRSATVPYAAISGYISDSTSNTSGGIIFGTRVNPADANLTEAMRILPSGSVGIGTTTISAKLHSLATTEQLRLGYDASNYSSFTISSAGDLTIAPSGSDTNITGNLDVSGTFAAGTANALTIDASGNLSTTGTLTAATNETINGVDINAGAISDVTTLSASSTITFSSFTANGGILYTNGSGVLAQTTVGTLGQCLTSAGGGTPTWGSCGGSGSLWRLTNGAFSPINDTVDILIGSNASASAKFAFLNVNPGSGVPTASIAGTTANAALYMTGEGTIATTMNRALLLNPTGGNVGIGTTTANSKLAVYGALSVFDSSNNADISLASPTGGGINPTRGVTGRSNALGLVSEGDVNVHLDSNSNSSSAFKVYANSITDTAGSEVFRVQEDGDVGIGTTTPTVKTHVFNTVDGTFTGLAIDNRKTYGVGTGINETSRLILSVTDGSGTDPLNRVMGYAEAGPEVETTSVNGYLALGTRTSGAETEKLRITSAGYVGIGTTAPALDFDVVGTGSIARFGSATSTENPTLEVRNGAGSLRLFAAGATDSYLTGTTQGDVGVIVSSGDDYFIGNQNVAPYFSIKDGGNVGIGTSAPSSLLSVGSTSQFNVDTSGNLTTSGKFNVGGLTGVAYNAISDSGTATFASTDNDLYIEDILEVGGSIYLAGKQLTPSSLWQNTLNAFHPGYEYAGVADLLLGGTSTTSAKFAFKNVASGTPTASISANTGGHALYIQGDGTIATALNKSLLLNPNGGNVGIGTTDATSKLTIGGASSVISNTSGDITFNSASGLFDFSGDALSNFSTARGTDGTAGAPTFSFTSDTDTGIFLSSVGVLGFSVGGTEHAALNSSGYFNAQRFTDTANANYFFDPAATDISLTAAGKVGLGTTSPIHKLQVTGAITGKALVVLNETGDQNILVASNSGTNRMVLTNSGYLGLATTSPVDPLHVYRNDTSVSTHLRLEQAGTGDAALQFLLSAQQAWVMGIDNSDSDKFKIASTVDVGTDTALSIDTSGNVGIGTTTSTTYRLSVTNSATNPSAIQRGIFGQSIATITSANANAIAGVFGSANSVPSLGITHNASAIGVNGQVLQEGAGTLTNAMGMYSLISNTSTGTITAAYGNLIQWSNPSGTIGTGYGLFIDDVTATTDYGIYQATSNDDNLFNAVNNLFPSMGSGAGNRAVCFTDANGNLTKSATTCTNPSSIAYKENVADLNYGLDDLMNLRPVSYNFKASFSDDTSRKIGFIAQEVLNVIPELVQYDGNGTVVGLEYDKLTSLNTKSIQELALQVNTLAGASSPMTLNQAGQLVITNADTTAVQVATPTGSLITNVQAFLGATIGQLKAGFIRTQSLVADMSIRSPQVETDLLSPTTGQDLTVKLADQASTLQVTNNNNQTVTSFDNAGNATFSGEVTAKSSRLEQLEARMAEVEALRAQTAEIVNATISGTLYADNIDQFEEKVANSLKQPSLLESLINDTQASVSASLAQLFQVVDGAGYATGSGSVNKSLEDLALGTDDVTLGASALFVNEYFEVNGTAYVADALGVGNQILIGQGTRLADGVFEYIDTTNPDQTVLHIQPAGKGTLSLMAGLMTLNQDGKVLVNGDLIVNGNLAVQDTLLTDLIKPTDFTNPLQVQLATQSGVLGETTESRFEIINELGTPVATISADGRATFNAGLGVGAEDLTATTSGTVQTQQTSGKATVKAFTNEVVIKTDKVNADSLVYVTPVGSTANRVLYVKQQVADNPFTTLVNEAQFVVGFDSALSQDVTFNWWIVN